MEGLAGCRVLKRWILARSRDDQRLEEVAEQTPVTPDTALRLAKFFGTTPQFWMNMQASYDLATEAKAKKAEIDAIEHLEAA